MGRQLNDDSKKTSRIPASGYCFFLLLTLLRPVAITVAGDDSDAPPGLRKPSRRHITLNLFRGPCEEPLNHSPDLAPSRGSPAWFWEERRSP